MSQWFLLIPIWLSLVCWEPPAAAKSFGAKDLVDLKTVDAVSAGADATGVDDSSASLAAAVASGGVRLSVPCGIYRMLANVPLPSDTEIMGSGDCTQFLIDPQMKPNGLFKNVLATTNDVRSVFSNADFLHGNSNIIIKNLRVRAPIPLVQGQYHAFSFYHTGGITIDKTTVEGSGTIHDGNHTVFINSHNFRFVNNRHVGGGSEGSIDVWDGSSDFLIANNYCDGSNKIQRCITLNGVSTGNKDDPSYKENTTKNGVVKNNIIKNTKNVGIMVVGLYNAGPPPVYGRVENVDISNNVIEGVSKFHGIWIGEADGIVVTNNTIRHAASSCIYVASGGPNGQTRHIDLVRNRCVDSGAEGAIVVGNTADAPDNVLLDRNEVSSQGEATYGYDVLIRHGASGVRLVSGAMRPGRAGAVKDGGTGTKIDEN